MPYYSDSLLSNFSPMEYAPVTSPFFNPPEPLPASVLSTMRMVDFVGYAAVPKELKGKRYTVKAGPGGGKRATDSGQARRNSGPRFRSDKNRYRRSIPLEAEEEEVSSNLGFRTDRRHFLGKSQGITARSRSNIQNLVLRISILGRYATPKSS